jgi:ElaB/YqjD/DUF883 family membrane-anchored ribosome-binding protein
MPADNEDTKTEIAILKRDLNLLTGLAEKFDIAIDRLTAVASSVDKMLAIHETRLENQERQSEVIHSRISDFRKEIIDEIKDLRDENTSQHKSVGERLDKLEKWRWFIIGISAGFGFLLAHSDIVTKLFS